MSEAVPGLPLTKNPSNTIKMLEYRITRRADLSLAFDPPAGSRELANALSMKYPMCENLEQQLQSALLDFINTETEESREYTFSQPKNRQPSLSSTTSVTTTESSPSITSNLTTAPTDFQSSMLVWNITTGKPVEKKRNRIKYDSEKRVKVAGVRKSGACDFHRKKKTECTCSTSPLAQKSPARRQRSLTHSTNQSVDDLSVSSASTETIDVQQAPDNQPLNYHSENVMFDADLSRMSEFDFASDFALWDVATLVPFSDSILALSNDNLSELPFFNHDSTPESWPQERLWK